MQEAYMEVDTCPNKDNTLVPKPERSGSARPLEHHCVGLALLMTTSVDESRRRRSPIQTIRRKFSEQEASKQ
jgi:hypothetical protein